MVEGRKPNFPLDNCKIKIVRHHYRFLDFDNMVGSLKPLIDSLTVRHTGIIQDDDYHTTGPWECTQEFRAKHSGSMTFIRIEGLQEAKPRPETVVSSKRGEEYCENY